jgi:hypothetical protein
MLPSASSVRASAQSPRWIRNIAPVAPAPTRMENARNFFLTGAKSAIVPRIGESTVTSARPRAVAKLK